MDKTYPNLPEEWIKPTEPQIDPPITNSLEDFSYIFNPINPSDIKVPPPNCVEVFLFRMSLNPSDINVKPRDDIKKTADNIKIALKASSLFEKALDDSMFKYANDYCQYFGAFTDTCLAAQSIGEDKLKSIKSIKGFLYIGSALAKVVEIQNKNPKTGTAVGILGGVFKIGRGLIDLFGKKDDQKPYQKEGALCDIASGACDFAAKIPALKKFEIPITAASLTFMAAAAFFKDGKYAEGVFTLLIGTVVTSGLLFVTKGALKVVFKALSETIRSAFNLSVSPLLVTPVSAIAAAIVMTLVSTLVTQLILNILSLAGGGFLVPGQPFIAREAGPELVGTINGRSAVVNNDQIVEAVSQGTYEAFTAALFNKNSKTATKVSVFLDGKLIATSR